MAKAKWAPKRARLVQSVALLTLAIQLSGFTAEPSQALGTAPEKVYRDGRFDLDVQRETRLMLTQLKAAPECVLLVPVGHFNDVTYAVEAWHWVALGGPLRGALALAPGLDDPLARVDAALGSSAAERCVVAFKGLDCHLVDVSVCDPHFAAGDPLLTDSFRGRMWNVEREYGRRRHEVRLESRLLRAQPGGTSASLAAAGRL